MWAASLEVLIRDLQRRHADSRSAQRGLLLGVRRVEFARDKQRPVGRRVLAAAQVTPEATRLIEEGRQFRVRV